MSRTKKPIVPVQKLRFTLLILLIGLCLVGGGASRVDVRSLLFVVPGAALVLTALIAIPRPMNWGTVRVPLILLACLAALMLFQLIPLPPELWTKLPGHAPFVEIASAGRFPQPWRPISLTPDLTLSSLADLVIPLTALIGFASLSPDERTRLPGILLVGIFCSAVLATAQLATGPNSFLYTYDITNRGAAVGLFANRNHQAVLLACAVPLLASWISLGRTGLTGSSRRWLFFFLLVMLLPLTLVTGSRAGLLLFGASVALTSLLFRVELFPSHKSGGTSALVLPLVVVGSILAAGALTVLLSRAEAWQRLLNIGFEDEYRLGNLSTFWSMLAAYFPLGSGFGSFDPLFRYVEPSSQLQPFYLNHAHNDLLELLITGGIGGALILLAFLAWLIKRSRAIARRHSSSPMHSCARAGLIVILLLLLSSLVDYPLRTPMLALMFALSAAFVSAERRPQS